VSEHTDALLGAGRSALEDGDWRAAEAAFRQALEAEETPTALFGLGQALLWRGETDTSGRLHERAYAGFRRAGDPAEAALCAINMYFIHGACLGNEAAAGGWMGRLGRLVEGFDLEPLRGWLILVRSDHRGRRDPAAGEALAREALAIARAAGDVDLELCALSQVGAMLVEAGALEEGLPLIDEAMAGSLGGEGRSLDTVVFTSCTTITCCSRAAQFARAAQWIRASDDFVRRHGSPHVFTVCRLHLGTVLFSLGRWPEAEHELQEALRMSRGAEPALFAEALAKLAELRLAQGRIEEAAGLLAGIEDRDTSVCALAALHLARGEVDAAAAALRRRMRVVRDRCLDCGPVVELLGEADLAHGDTRAAATRARRLVERATRAGCEVVVAQGERALGRALAARGHAGGAVHLERALAAFERLEMPLEAARSRLALAHALAPRAPGEAVAAARSALAALDALGAARHADDAAALLRGLGVRVARGGPRGTAELSRRELEVLRLLGEGLTNRGMAERLFLTRKTVEHHVRSVLRKLGVTNRTEAAAYALRHLERESPDLRGGSATG
jgi:DNA-binding CsgD family transcriptional regulator